MTTRKTETKNKRTTKKAGILLTEVQEPVEVSEPIVETEVSNVSEETEPVETEVSEPIVEPEEQEVNEAVIVETEETEVSEPIVEQEEVSEESEVQEPLEPYRQVLKKLESEAIERNHNLLSNISDTLLHLSPTKEQEAQLNTLANTYWGQVLNSNATFEYKAEAVLSGIRNII